MLILVVEDNKQQSEIIKTALEAEHFTVNTAFDGAEALKKIEIKDYDCFIIDLDLPKVTGQELVEEIRKLKLLTPILILTANEGQDSKVENLDAGADDYLTKPFAIDELTSRVKALLRRPQNYEPPVLEVGDLTLNYNSREVTIDKEPIQLSSYEFRVLEFLCRNRDRVCTKTMIEEHVWGYDKTLSSNVVEATLYKIRTKLGDHKDVIKTIPQIGYKFQEREDSEIAE